MTIEELLEKIKQHGFWLDIGASEYLGDIDSIRLLKAKDLTHDEEVAIWETVNPALKFETVLEKVIEILEADDA